MFRAFLTKKKLTSDRIEHVYRTTVSPYPVPVPRTPYPVPRTPYPVPVLVKPYVESELKRIKTEKNARCGRHCSSELIAKFIDAKLRAGNKSSNDEEMEGTLDVVLTLFRYIQARRDQGP